MKLTGKKALVTGGSRGIGAAIARRLAEDGADVVITYSASPDAAQKVVDTITASGRKGYAVKANAAEPETLSAPIEEAIKQLGGIDILVNSAGIFDGDEIAKTDLSTFDESLAVNVRAAFETVHIAQAHMASGGRIILIGSILGERASKAGISVYNATKFAVAGLGRSWAHDLAPRNITVNIVQPGPIDTDMNPANSEWAKEQLRSVPMGRYGRPEEIASVVSFFASEDSSYVTGATINVDGGVNA